MGKREGGEPRGGSRGWGLGGGMGTGGAGDWETVARKNPNRKYRNSIKTIRDHNSTLTILSLVLSEYDFYWDFFFIIYLYILYVHLHFHFFR